ncbi:MAG: hypothetical protein ACK4NZ_01315 [Tsuneonella sp.]
MASRSPSFLPTARLQSKDGICAYLGDISHATYDNWQARGIVPGPVPHTNRYDIRAHDHALDKASGMLALSQRQTRSPLDEWEQSHAA